jgi:hypothetical protein
MAYSSAPALNIVLPYLIHKVQLITKILIGLSYILENSISVIQMHGS